MHPSCYRLEAKRISGGTDLIAETNSNTKEQCIDKLAGPRLTPRTLINLQKGPSLQFAQRTAGNNSSNVRPPVYFEVIMGMELVPVNSAPTLDEGNRVARIPQLFGHFSWTPRPILISFFFTRSARIMWSVSSSAATVSRVLNSAPKCFDRNKEEGLAAIFEIGIPTECPFDRIGSREWSQSSSPDLDYPLTCEPGAAREEIACRCTVDSTIAIRARIHFDELSPSATGQFLKSFEEKTCWCTAPSQAVRSSMR